MSNTPEQQAELYRKAAETIEMCAPHGIEPLVKFRVVIDKLSECSLKGNLSDYEFPIAVIEDQQVWADTVVYNSLGRAITAKHMKVGMDYSLIEPKQPLCEVEGKPVYKGDKLWCDNELREIVSRNPHCDSLQWIGRSAVYNEDAILGMPLKYWSWNQPKRTVMVEMLVEDAQRMADSAQERFVETYAQDRVGIACRKALDNLKDK